jgi:hypothetical protein
MNGSPATRIIDLGTVAVIGRKRFDNPPANSARGGMGLFMIRSLVFLQTDDGLPQSLSAAPFILPS